ncbi:MAG: hypothetical protein IPN34_07790 [Planctomycetes bacterium]|nr:hypothetical protein [Planctomycetota bacterium]
MSSPVRPSAWSRFRYHVRRLLGRTRFDDLERELRELREQTRSASERTASELARLVALHEQRVEVEDDYLRSVADQLRSLESRLAESLAEQIEEQWRSFESRRAPLLALIDQLRSAVEESISATARMDSMILRTLEKGQEIESEVNRRGSRLAEVLDGLRATVADAVQRLEERHRDWLAAQASIDRGLTTGLGELRTTFATGSERGAALQRELDEARGRERALADQAAHLIEVLGQSRRELAAAGERAAEADEAKAARADLQRELERVREDLEAASAEVEEVREAHRAFLRWKESSDAEIARLASERDRLLLESLRSEEATRGAHDPSFGAPST